ncbi:hypothetical protein F0562_017550 [Nyssa sinensis]|uniref:Uncharacterized protein n=1 Tax=Nyssa sinensis TaxID=561372 RepID=A0A5J4ZI32_9ASTE|nr:hypothetical protein F0562_017550 [Nyssa sinensis]
MVRSDIVRSDEAYVNEHELLLVNCLDSDDTPDVPPPLWQPTFSTWTSLITVNNSVIQDNPVAAAVSFGLISPRDKGLLVARIDVNAVRDPLVLYIRAVNSVLNMARHLYARDAIIRSLNDHIVVLQRLLSKSNQRTKEFS